MSIPTNFVGKHFLAVVLNLCLVPPTSSVLADLRYESRSVTSVLKRYAGPFARQGTKEGETEAMIILNYIEGKGEGNFYRGGSSTCSLPFGYALEASFD